MAGEVYLTRAGFEKMLAELERLKTTERSKITKAIAEARALGDLKENAEYHAAKEEQGHCEARIVEMEGKLSNVRVIEDQHIPGDKVYIGAFVTIKDLGTKEDIRYQIVGPEEADYDNHRVSIFSPIGKGLMGHAAGEELKIMVPAGALKYKILKIERP